MISIVSTLYNSSKTLPVFADEALAAGTFLSDSVELILVDDGSPDDSNSIACRLADNDPRVQVVELSRNFGHHKAMMTGLSIAKGDLVFLIDSDLEEHPAVLREFHEKLKEGDFDVVYGFQERRKGGILERWSGAIFYLIINLLIPYRIPTNHLTVRLMKRDYVNALLEHREQQTIIGGLWVITGFKQVGIAVSKISKGSTSYCLRKRWRALIDSITCFSEVPLIAIFYLGILISLLAILVGSGLIAWKICVGSAIQGWVSVMLSVWFLGGLIIFCLGTIGIYVSKIFIETKNRPYTIIKKVHRHRGVDGGVGDKGAAPGVPGKL